MSIGKQTIIWALAIIFGGGLISLAIGHGFFGEKAPTPPVQVRTAAPMPTQGSQCDPNRTCRECHPGM